MSIYINILIYIHQDENYAVQINGDFEYVS